MAGGRVAWRLQKTADKDESRLENFRRDLAELSDLSDTAEARAVFDRMLPKVPLRRQGLLWNGLLTVYGNARDWEGAEALHEEARAKKAVITLKTLGKLVAAASEDGNLEEMAKWFQKIKDTPGLDPDIAVYNAVVAGHAKAGDVHEAERWLKKMLFTDLFSLPAFKSVIDACVEADEARPAASWLHKAQNAGLRPSADMYESVIKAYERCKDEKNAGEWRDQLAAGLGGAESGEAKGGRGRSALEQIQYMSRNSVLTGDRSYKGLIEETAQQDPKAAKAVLEELGKHGVTPRIESFTTVMNYLAKAKDIEGVMSTYMGLQQAEVTPDITAMNVVLDALVRSGNAQKAWNMLQTLPYPSVVSFSCVINGLAKEGDVETALLALEDMEDEGLAPSIITFNGLINGACSTRDLEQARRWLQDAKDRGLKPNVRTYTPLVNAYQRQGDVENAVDVLATMMEDGVEANSVAWHGVMGACGNAKDGVWATVVLRRMAELQVPLHQRTYRVLEKALGTQQAYKLRCELGLSVSNKEIRDENWKDANKEGRLDTSKQQKLRFQQLH